MSGQSGSCSHHHHNSKKTCRRKRAELLKCSRHHFLFLLRFLFFFFLPKRDALLTFVFSSLFNRTADSFGRYDVNIVLYLNEVYLLCDQLGNQPIITQQSFKNVLPKLLVLSPSTHSLFAVTWPNPDLTQSHSLTSTPPPPPLTSLWIRLSLCARHGVCWTGCPHFSCCQVHRCSTPVCASGFSRVHTRL